MISKFAVNIIQRLFTEFTRFLKSYMFYFAFKNSQFLLTLSCTSINECTSIMYSYYGIYFYLKNYYIFSRGKNHQNNNINFKQMTPEKKSVIVKFILKISYFPFWLILIRFLKFQRINFSLMLPDFHQYIRRLIFLNKYHQFSWINKINRHCKYHSSASSCKKDSNFRWGRIEKSFSLSMIDQSSFQLY
jgi:hypothetical protein